MKADSIDRMLAAIQRMLALFPRLRRCLPRKAPPIDRVFPPGPEERFRADDPLYQMLSLLERQVKYYEKYVPLLPTDLEDEMEAATKDLERAMRPRKQRRRRS